MFILSILLVVLSSYLITTTITPSPPEGEGARRAGGGCLYKDNLLYFFLIAFSQIVLSFEVLSLFSAISKNNFLICNLVFLIISVIFFSISTKHINNLSTHQLINLLTKIKNSFKLDKSLIFLGICFIISNICNIVRIIFFPISMLDAYCYYYPRCTTWLQQGNILHFLTPDTRELIMPVNMDFLYMWQLMFTKNESSMEVYSYIGYLVLIYIVYKFLCELKFSIRSRLWTIFVFSSFALVLVEATNPCADLFAGTLILGSIYLFLKSIRNNNDKTAMFFSSLALALAVGTKTTAIIALPSLFLIMCAICYIYRKNLSPNPSSKGREDSSTYQPLLIFSILFIINFIIFSSYNYILNFIQFSNPFTDPSCYLINEFTGGFKGYISNVIKYFFGIFDMSGMPEYININSIITNVQNWILELFGTNNEMGGALGLFTTDFVFDNTMGITISALGFMGLLTFLPSIIYSIKRTTKKHLTSTILAILALSVIFNILLFSRVMVFTNSNMRYILTFTVIAFPCLVYSYPRRKCLLWKLFLCLIMFNYFVCTNISGPLNYIKDYITKFKYIQIGTYSVERSIFDTFIKMEPKNIGIISSHPGQEIYFIEKLKLYGFYVDKILPEIIEEYDISKYDYLITDEVGITSTLVLKYEERKQYPYRFVARCDYTNRYMQPLFGDEKPAFAQCYIPFEYLFDKGFIEDKSYDFGRYTILKKII